MTSIVTSTVRATSSAGRHVWLTPVTYFLRSKEMGGVLLREPRIPPPLAVPETEKEMERKADSLGDGGWGCPYLSSTPGFISPLLPSLVPFVLKLDKWEPVLIPLTSIHTTGYFVKLNISHCLLLPSVEFTHTHASWWILYRIGAYPLHVVVKFDNHVCQWTL